MKLIALILLSFSVVTGCAKTHMDTTVNNTAPVNTTPATPLADSITYLALGDSYTIGESVEHWQAYPYELVSQLRNNGFRQAAAPKIIAMTGWRTDQLQTAITAAHLNRKFDFVTLLIGVNNQYQHGSEDTYRTQFKQLLDTAISYAQGNLKRVFVLSIPDYSVTPFGKSMDPATIAQQIDQFNAINLDESQKAGVTYINITDISRQAATDSTLIASDGLHPSYVMYEAWVARLLPLVKASLQQ
jgi:lysophospholipase L1-like esterase